MSGKSLAIRRITKDIKEINKSPVEGIGIASLENNIMKYVVNIRLMSGPYKDYCVQLLLTFPENYPSKPPKILIYPDQSIDGQYHHHIFQDSLQDENGHYFKKFCFDLLDNDFMSTKEENSGWNPSYTISSLLLQVQNFISDPDMHGYIPPENKIKQLMDSMKTYSRNFKIVNDDGKTEIVKHTWEKPFPEMHVVKKEESKEKENKNEIIDENEIKEKIRMQQIKENLTCFMLKLNYIDDPDILLGYPIIQNKIMGVKEKIELYPIPELLTYDGYMAQIGKQDDKLDFYFDVKFKSANNQFYNYWVPIYIDENHYKKNRTTILNSFSIIKYGAHGLKEYDFEPEQIFEILPILLNKMIIGIFKGKSNICSSFIRCYFQYVLLFKKLCLEFEQDYLNYVNHNLNLIKKNNYSPDKNVIPDIGNFFMLLFFSNKDTHNEKMKKMWYSLFEEFSIRQSYWIFHENENRYKMKQIMFKDQIPSTINIIFQSWNENAYFIDIEYDKREKFVQDLKNKKIYDKIINLILSDNNFKSVNIYEFGYFYDIEGDDNSDTITDANKIRTIVTQTIQRSFKDLYTKCDKKTKDSLKKIIEDNLDFSSYFDTESPMFKEYIKRTEIKNDLYDSFNVDKLLKKLDKDVLKEVLKFAYECQNGNKLLLITFFTQKKIEDKEFMKELEKNYGIYLDVETFIKEMNQKLSEIKSYHELFNYIGSEFGKDMDDYDILLNSYIKAKDKEYIKTHNNNHGNNRGRGRGDYRGRGRGEFRGRGRGEFRGRGRGEFRGRGRGEFRGRGRGEYRGRGYS